MKLDLYGCTYVEEFDYNCLMWNVYELPSYWDSLDELCKKKEKVTNREFETSYRFYFKPKYNKPIFIRTFEVDKFDPTELIQLDNKEYRILHHSYDVENNTQIVVIDKEIKKEPLSQERKEQYYQSFIEEKECDLQEINKYIKDKESYTENKKPRKGFWAKLFQ